MLPTEGFVELSRWQFAFTTLYHFIFVPLTLAFVLAVTIAHAAPPDGKKGGNKGGGGGSGHRNGLDLEAYCAAACRQRDVGGETQADVAVVERARGFPPTSPGPLRASRELPHSARGCADASPEPACRGPSHR